MEKIEAWETTDTAIFKYKEDAAKHEMDDVIWTIMQGKLKGFEYREIADFIINRKEEIKIAIEKYEKLMTKEK